MRLSDLRPAWIVLLVAAVGCTAATQTVVTTAASDRVGPSLPDFTDAQELEQTILSFGECVEESFPIVVRFRAQPFVGLSTSVASQRREEGDLVDSVVAGCNGQMDLDRRISVYRSEHPVSPEDRQALANDFVSCASKISSETSDLISEANLDSPNSVERFVSDLVYPGDVLPGDDLVAISECMAEMTGPEHVFRDGHPWFTP